MINISYRRNDNVIYSFFTRYPLDNDFEYNWYCKLFGHFKNIYPHVKGEIIGKHIVKYLSEDKKYYGTAKCHPDDVFNEYRGEQLARHRLIVKYLKDVNRINFDIRSRIRKELEIHD